MAEGRTDRLVMAPRVAIVHDYLTQRGGAERVVLSMLRAFPHAELHTSLYDPDGTFPDFRDVRIRTMAVNALRPLRHHHRAALPLLAMSFQSHNVDADVVLCSSSGWAHGVATKGRKVVYCYTPARWLYQAKRYWGPEPPTVSRWLGMMALRAVHRPLVRWDVRAALSADVYVAISQVVRKRISDRYGIDAEVIPAPQTVDVTGRYEPIPGLEPGFLLCVSRLLRYKNVGAVVGAFRRLPDQRLVVAGTGPLSAELRAVAPMNVQLVGTVSDARLRWLYRSCAGLIAASHEDFGLVPLEGAAFARPTAALRWGGFLDTVVEGETGVFFDAPDSLHIADAVRRLRATQFAPLALHDHAERFDEHHFIQRLRHVVDRAAAIPAASLARC
jgi:glycosyltransferase involved in cell wall biosynthesis